MLPYWGVCLVRTPGGIGATNDGLFGQSDLPLTILDAAGLKLPAQPFAGRSVMRHYDAPRDLPMSAVYHRRMGVVRADDGVELMGEHFNPLAWYRTDPLPGRDGFAALTEVPGTDLSEYIYRPVLAELARRQRAEQAQAKRRPIVLVQPGTYVLPALPLPNGGNPLTKNQYLYSDRDAWVRVKVKIRPGADDGVGMIGMNFLGEQYELERQADGWYTAFRETLWQIEPGTAGNFSVGIKAFGRVGEPVTMEVAQLEVVITPLK